MVVIALALPFVGYSVAYPIHLWPNQTTAEKAVVLLLMFSLFVGITCGAISLFLDAKRDR